MSSLTEVQKVQIRKNRMQQEQARAHAPGQDDAARVILDLENNRLLAALYGPHDRHLARIEQTLDVVIVNRGNRLLITGAPGACEMAAQVLQALYQRLERGEILEQGDLDGTVRMMGGSPGLVDAGGGPKAASPSQKPMPGGGADAGGGVRINTRNRIIQPRSPMQERYMAALQSTLMTFGIGPAGTGKTYLAVAMAVSRMLSGDVERIILSRPAVEAGENLGFLPGDLKEKVDPYLRPLYDALYDMMPADQVEKRLLSGQIEVAPLAYMRGRTLANACVILDEAQNTTPVQMKMFLTRFGENSHMMICGDPSQVDLPPHTQSGLMSALAILEDVEGIAVIRFTEKDVVRHPLVARIVAAYERQSAQAPKIGS
ncbi:PhoH-like protein [alpha proteobacterium Q-1]|nr:PhoH-like protein [alpha proteobacterium Q-1]